MSKSAHRRRGRGGRKFKPGSGHDQQAAIAALRKALSLMEAEADEVVARQPKPKRRIHPGPYRVGEQHRAWPEWTWDGAKFVPTDEGPEQLNLPTQI
jgi:hypothetical protein